MTRVKSAPSAGAEMMTRLAPASRCLAAASRLVKMPVHSSATSTLRSFHGSFAGSRSAVTWILPLPASIQSPPVVISCGKRPCTLSYLSKCALDATGPRSLTPTTWMSLRLFSAAARNTSRPMRPKPLIATLTAISILRGEFASNALSLSMFQPRQRRLDDLLGSDAEMAVKLFRRRRGSEPGHADHRPGLADIMRPAEGAGGLDRDAWHAAEDTGAIGGILLVEQLPARHRDNGGGDAFGLEGLARRQREGNLRAGGE